MRILRTFASVIGIALIVGAFVALRPSVDVSADVDPGLDSGNATVDRTSVPGQTILLYKMTSNSTFKAPVGVTDVRVLVIGGGGGGAAGEATDGGGAGGGGGAGEYLHQTNFSVTPGQAVSVTVGGGGVGNTDNQSAGNGGSGSDSKFGTLTARGGGGGSGINKNGVAGGSGGGAGAHCTVSNTVPGGNSTAVAPGVGHRGGNNESGCVSGAAGGGGAGAVGVNANDFRNGSAGGAGLQNDITGTNTFYAAGGGGGGGGSSGTGANGGSSIGGQGGNASGGNGFSAGNNTGSGGGGGGSFGKGGTGGSAIVIVRFATRTTPDPGGVTGMRMWYKADGTGNTNAQWNDASGFGVNLAQSDTTKQPALTANTLNFNPAYVFDGTDDVFTFANHPIGDSDSMSAFYVATATDAAGGYRYLNEFGDDHPSVSNHNGKPNLYVRDTSSVEDEFGTVEALQPHVYGFVSPNGGGSKVISVDNREQTKSISGSYTTSGGAGGNTFGNKNASAGTGWEGPIAEALYFNKQLNAAERQQVSSYLALKYGVTLGSGSIAETYFDSGSTRVWPADITYKNNIAGIGRDDTSTLNQKQSKSAADGSLVTIGHGDIAATNQANTNNFTNDKTFMVWGHDSGATDQTTAVSGTNLVRMGRIWKTVVTDTPGAVKVQIPTSIITRNSADLLVSSSATFDGSSQQVPMSVNGSNYEATTTLAAGTHYFTFASDAGSDIQFTSKTATDTNGSPITTYTPGQPLEYHLTVKNNGPDDAGTVTVTDTLPTGVVPTTGGSTGGGWTCNVAGQTVTCTRPSLATGATAPEILVEATIASSVTGQKVNTASASVANDPDPSNNSASVTLDAAPVADLSITKGHTGTPVAGGQLTYNFTVKNAGPSDVSSFTVTDNLDSNLTFDSSTAEVNCTGTTNVSCEAVAPLAASDTRSFSITVNIDPIFPGGDITNTGTVAVPSGTTDPNPSNNTSNTDDTSVTVSTDLAITKSHTGNFTAGDNNSFTISVANNGPSDAPASSITVTDTLDEDFTYVSGTGTDWSCNSPPATTVTCTYSAALTASSTAPDITVTVAVDPVTKGSITNTADVSGTTPDPDNTNNTSQDDITVDADADLAITKDHVGTAFTAGQQEKYTLSVVNNGPSADSPTYSITDALPTGLTFVSSTGAANCTSNDGTNITCTGGGIGASDPAQVTTITVAVAGSATGSLTNSATVAPDPSVTDPNQANNTNSDTVNIEPSADLAVVKTPPSSMTAGDTANYTITTTNNGPSDVSSYTITDSLDANLSYQSSSPNVCSAVGQDITCTGAAITNGNNDAITITVAVAPTATAGSTINNTATVAPPSGINDPDPTNNSDTVSNTVDTSADLSITKSHTGNFTVGGNGTFTLSVANNGPSDSSTVTVTDVLPDGLTYLNAGGSGVSCDNSGQTVTCTVGPTFGKGESVSIPLTVRVDGDVTVGSLDNTASVSSATTDPTPGDTSSTDTVTIDPATADLTATKTAQGSLVAGQPVTYRFEVTNNGGPDNAGVVTISDTLPAYLSYQSFNSVSGGAWDCGGSSGQDVTCTLGLLAVSDTAVVDVTVLVDQDAPDTADNSASVTFNGTDPSPPNPSTSDPVSYAADLEVKLTHESETYHSGDTVNFTYTVINHGPSQAQDVVLTDTLPDGLTFENIVATNTETGEESVIAKVVDILLGTKTVSAAPNTPFNCSNSGQDVTCNANALSVGTYTITMTALISSTFTGDLTSVAQITSSTTDPNIANNTSTDTIVGVTEGTSGEGGGGGLAGTGQNLFVWLAAAMIAVLGAFFLYRRRKAHSTAGS